MSGADPCDHGTCRAAKTRSPRPTTLRLFADYGQIHLLDASSAPSFEDAWTAQATEDRVAVADGGVALGTADTADVSVTVERRDGPPEASSDSAGDHETEASVHVPSGKLVVMGCTDELAKAKRIDVGSGTFRLRIVHTGLAKGKERIAVRLWPAAMAEPSVVRRWVPPPKQVRAWSASKPPRTARKAAECLRAGDVDLALPVLEKLADKGDVEAALSLAEVCAFRDDDEGVVRRATALFDHPDTIGSSNGFTEMGRLVARAVRRIALRRGASPGAADDEALAAVEELAGKMRLPGDVSRSKYFGLDDDGAAEVADPKPGARSGYDAHLAKPSTERDYRGHPRELLRHCFAVAMGSRLEDELVRLWADPIFPRTFKEAVCVARWRAFRGKQDDAWAILEPNLPTWWPLYYFQVAPVELLHDRWLGPLLLPERRERILAMPRGSEA